MLKLLFSILAGVMFALSLHPLNLWFLAPIAIALFLYSLRNTKPTQARTRGFFFGLTAYSISFSWFFEIFGPYSIVLIAINSLFPALFGWLTHLLKQKKWHPISYSLMIASSWTAIEFIRSELWWLRFPWASAGHGFGPMFLSEYIGIYGIGFTMILSIAFLLENSIKHRVAGAAILLSLYSGAVLQRIDAPVPKSGISVAAVQSESMSISIYKKLVETNNVKADVIVWPEYAVNEEYNKEPRTEADLKAFLGKHADYLIFGSKEAINEQAFYNTAYTLSPSDGIVGKHAKNRPVHFFVDGAPGTTAKSVSTSKGKIGTPICFDCDYESIIRRMVHSGAEWIAAPTMDAEHWTKRQHLQHAELVRHRARENGRYMVVAATSGKTQFIDHKGRTYADAPLFDEHVLSSYILPMQHITIYTRIGWIFPWICMFFLTCFILHNSLRFFSTRFSKKPSSPDGENLVKSE